VAVVTTTETIVFVKAGAAAAETDDTRVSTNFRRLFHCAPNP
jgi:hypothetical protein